MPQTVDKKTRTTTSKARRGTLRWTSMEAEEPARCKRPSCARLFVSVRVCVHSCWRPLLPVESPVLVHPCRLQGPTRRCHAREGATREERLSRETRRDHVAASKPKRGDQREKPKIQLHKQEKQRKEEEIRGDVRPVHAREVFFVVVVVKRVKVQ